MLPTRIVFVARISTPRRDLHPVAGFCGRMAEGSVEKLCTLAPTPHSGEGQRGAQAAGNGAPSCKAGRHCELRPGWWRQRSLRQRGGGADGFVLPGRACTACLPGPVSLGRCTARCIRCWARPTVRRSSTCSLRRLMRNETGLMGAHMRASSSACQRSRVRRRGA